MKTAMMDFNKMELTTNFLKGPNELSPEDFATVRALQGDVRGIRYHLGMGYVFCLQGQRDKNFSENQIDSEVERVIYNLGHFYGKEVPSYDVSGMKPDVFGDNTQRVQVICRRVKKYFAERDITNVMWKCYGDETVAYYTLEWTGAGDEELDIFRLIIHFISSDSGILLTSHSFILRTSTETISPMLYATMGKNKKDTMEAIRYISSVEQVSNVMVQVIRQGIKFIRMLTSSNQDRYKKLTYDGFHHNESELTAMRYLMKDWNPPIIVRPILNHDWLPDGFKNKTKFYDADSQKQAEGLPIIDLTSSEWSTVRKYVEEHYPKDTTCPMQKILHHLPYGNRLIVNYPVLFQKDTIPLEVNIEIHDVSFEEDDGSVRETEGVEMNVCFRGNGLCQYIAQIDIHELNDEFGIDELAELMYTAPLIHHTKLVKTPEELFKLYPKSVVELFTQEKNIRKFISDLLDMLIIMHDRPEKFVEIEEKRRRGSLPKNPHSKSSPRDKEFVTRYIIKTIYQGKKFVKQHTDGDTIRRYVTEHWKRRGHWRRLRSGEEIWIEETNCTRHLEMSNTPVVINYEEETPRQYNVV